MGKRRMLWWIIGVLVWVLCGFFFDINDKSCSDLGEKVGNSGVYIVKNPTFLWDSTTNSKLIHHDSLKTF